MSTILTAAYTPRPITDQVRAAGLEWLAREWDEDHPYPERWQDLAAWVHPSWNATPQAREQRDEVFREFHFALRDVAALPGGGDGWQEYAHDLLWHSPEECQEVAAARAMKDARRLLGALMNGGPKG